MKNNLGAKLLFTVLSVVSYLFRDPEDQQRIIYLLVGVLLLIWFDWIWTPAVRRIGEIIASYFRR
jgi:hypothetical protein